MKFDGYGATIMDHQLGYVAERLASSLGGFVGRGKPMRRYANVLNVDVGNRMAAWIGHDAESGRVYVEGKGETSPQLAGAIRAHFPEHTAPRIDVAEDFDEPGAFEALQRIIRHHKGQRVKGGYVALPDDVEDGKTWSAGARGGVGYIRLYEAGKHPDRLHLARPNWVRAELECRPHYARDKAAAASMSPLDVWGMSAWTHRVGQAITTVQISRFEPEVRRFSHSKTQRYVANTYRRMFEEMMADGEHIEATFKHIWAEQDASDKRIRH